jgi:hypothetical protein
MQSTDQAAEERPELKDEAYEEKHVHEVYQNIAHHFSSTRYKVCEFRMVVFYDWGHC